MKILVVSQYFYPENFRINDICKEWIKRGYEVTVVTGIPNYPQGRFFKGYGLVHKREEILSGIRIIRLPIVPRFNNAICLMLNYLSFVVSGYIRSIFARLEYDVVFTFEVSPMTQALVGCRFAKKKHVKHFLYVQDLWPENVISITGLKNKFVIKCIDHMVDRIYKNSDEIFTTSPSFVDSICNRTKPVDSNKVHYWPQYAEDFYYPRERKPSKWFDSNDDSFKIVFTGNIGYAQGLDILPKTAVQLKSSNVKFLIVGNGRYLSSLQSVVRTNKVEDKFIFIPQQPSTDIPDILASCDAAFISFADDDLWRKTIPAKLQSYMACGMPIIAAAEGETERIIKEANCGVCSSIGNVYELCQKISEMMTANLADVGKRSRAYFDSHFEKQMVMDQMEVVLNLLD